MKIPKIRSATELRANLFETLREVQEGEPQLITHTKGSDGVVLISQSKLNSLLEENKVLKSIAKGRTEIQTGKGIPHAEVKRRLQEKIGKWRRQK